MQLTGKWIEAFTGAGPSTAGAKGGVPAPAAGQTQHLLRGDGTWQAPSWGTGIGGPFEGIKFYTGTSTTRTISSNTQDTTGSVFYYDDLTINSGITWSFVSPTATGPIYYFAPAIVFVKGTLWLKSDAVIRARNCYIGKSYVGGSGGAAGSPGSDAVANAQAGTFYPWYHTAGGGGGGGGASSSAAGGLGLAADNRNWDLVASGGGGTAGAKGTVPSGAGGNGGAGTATGPYVYLKRDPHFAHMLWHVSGSWGCPGGGGGGGGGAGGNGALGGDGAATVVIYCRNLKMESGAKIDCTGVAGSNGYAGSLGGGGGGAGGGGGGGAAHVMYGDLDALNTLASQTETLVTLNVSPSGTATIDARGGAGGTGGTSTAGVGGNGGAGEDGVVTFLKYAP